MGFLGFVDGELERSRVLLEAVVRELRTFRPYAVYTHDPEPLFVMDAVTQPQRSPRDRLHNRRCRLPRGPRSAQFPRARAHRPAAPSGRGALFSSNQPNFESDITAVLDVKLAAMRAHASQFTPEFLERMPEFWRDADGRSIEQFRRSLLF
ncbi:MAG: hypothetical protein U0360_08545 [Dehalococcoidia bacterium]